MDLLLLAALLLGGAYVLKTREQARRIALLGQHLGEYQIEKLMESLTQGYLRCLGEEDPQRREQIWQLLASSEQSVSSQFARFTAGFAKVDEARTRVSKLPIAVPFADKLFPTATFDLRKALAIHARGIADAANNVQQLTPKAKAFTLSAELFLMQHTCHWYCRSKTVASARMMARHKTSHAQLVEAVSATTRSAYKTLTGVS